MCQSASVLEDIPKVFRINNVTQYKKIKSVCISLFARIFPIELIVKSKPMINLFWGRVHGISREPFGALAKEEKMKRLPSTSLETLLLVFY